LTNKKNSLSSATIVDEKFIFPFILVTSLFALWGFANAVTDPMVNAFKKILELSNSEAAWVQMAFYGGYFSMALPAAIFIRKFNYKKGILLGLILYAIGALMFYPAAITEKFWFFCLGLYILTFGLAFLETTANPYVLAMGDPSTATRRLNLAQVFNPVGLLIGLLIAQQFVLKNLKSDDITSFENLDIAQKILIKTSDLIVIRDPYVILGLIVLIFFTVISVVKMPQFKEDDKDFSIGKTLSKLLSKKMYRLGVLAQAFYVGAQIMCWTYIYQYSEGKGINSVTAANFQYFAFILFLLGRIFGTYLLKSLNPEFLLRVFALFSSILIIVTIFSNDLYGLYSLVGVSFFMSLMFPTIYAQTLKGLSESDTKIGASGLVMAIVGGALMPKLQGFIIDFGGPGVADIKILGVNEINFSFVLPLISFSYIYFYGKILAKNSN
jgi:FHS family L-fucose permease-like MFS transporter